MPQLKTWIHLVWSTKNRTPFLKNKKVRTIVWKHIFENARNKGIHIDSINGYSDHVHCLVSLGSNQTIGKIVQMIKGESSKWINDQGLTDEHFSWQKEYFAGSISYSHVKRVRAYIFNQEAHHHTKTFEEEYEKIMDKYDLQQHN